MSGGGKGGSSTTSVKIPQWLEDPSKRAISRGEDIAQMDYMPHMGPDVAAFSPTQQAAFDNTNNAALSFGMGQSAGTGMPAAQDFGGGVMGHSSYPIYEQTVDAFEAAYPELAAQRNSFFGQPAQMMPQGGGQPQGLLSGGSSGSTRDRNYRNRNRGGSSSDYMRDNQMTSGSGGGFTSVRDMFDGGGAGSSGDTFKGGPLSGSLNNAGVRPLRSRR